MATAYTSLLGLALPVTGEISGTWGDTVNNAITSLLDSAVAGTTTLSTDADVTLTTTTGATNQARQAILLCSGARTAIRNITAPAQSKMYVVINNTTGGYGVVIRGAGPTTGVTVANGKTAVVVWNGSDFVEVAPATATTATNLAGGAAGSLPYQSGAGATTFLSIGTNNFVLTSNGTAPVWTTNTGTGNVVRATSPAITTPTITTSITAPLLIGGTGTTSTLALRSTSGVGTMGADIIFQTGNNGATEAMRILNSGNVGIGTSSPSQLLHVLGTSTKALIVTSSSTGFASVQTQSDGGTNDLEIVQYGTAATSTYFGVNRAGAAFLGASATTFGMGTKSSNPVILATNNTERLRIDSSGNVGIGTSAPISIFQVNNDSASAAIFATTKSQSGAAPSWSSRSNRGSIASPTAVLNGDILLRVQGAGYGTTGYQVAAQIIGYASETFSDTSSAGYLTITTTPTGSVTPLERMRIDSTGNVGIGTSSPSVALHVVGIVRATDAFAVRDSSNNLAGTFENDSTNLRINAEVSGKDMIFRTRTLGGSILERMRITADGNVGIGSASPVNKLDVVGSFGRGAPVTKTGNFTLAATENWVVCNGAGTITVTLPAASSWTGREVMIKTIAAQTVVSASSNVVPLTGGAAGTAILAATAGKWATLVSDGTNWVIMSAA